MQNVTLSSRLTCKDCKQPMKLWKKTRSNVNQREYFHCSTCESQAQRTKPIKGNHHRVSITWIAPQLPYEELESEVIVEASSDAFYPIQAGGTHAIN